MVESGFQKMPQEAVGWACGGGPLNRPTQTKLTPVNILYSGADE